MYSYPHIMIELNAFGLSVILFIIVVAEGGGGQVLQFFISTTALEKL
jgi:hypothetical protein